MSPTPIAFHVPGKLVLGGEWGILKPGNSCITLPTRGINVSIAPAAITTISSATYNLTHEPYHTLAKNTKLTLLQKAIEAGLSAVTAHGYQQINFHLALENDPLTYVLAHDQLNKLGIGSSACVTVGAIKAITQFHGIYLETEALFKLAVKAHYTAQNKLGSGFDIAAAAAGYPIIYQSFNQSLAIDSDDWESLTIKSIAMPEQWHFAVGFCGISASTSKLIKIFNDTRENNAAKIEPTLEHINILVHKLEQAILANNIQSGMALINDNRKRLLELSIICDSLLETPTLSLMIDLANAQGAAAKFSGAGGGDCVIALCPDKITKQKVYAAWESAGFSAADALLKESEISITKYFDSLKTAAS